MATSLYVGLLVYCLLSVAIGPAGLVAYRRLETRNTAMEVNLAALEGLHARLDSELEALKSDPDRAAVEARSLGYLREGETALILQDRSERAHPIDAGSVLPFAEPPAIDDSTLKEIALGAALAMLAFLCAPRGATGRVEPRRRP